MPDHAETAPGSRDSVALAADFDSRPAGRALKVLALATYPSKAAATRHRIVQYIAPLAQQGIAVDFRAFMTHRQFDELYQRRRLVGTAVALAASLVRRCRDIVEARNADVVFIQREVMLFGPPVFEYILTKLMRKPLVLDLDDATYIPYISPTYGRLVGLLKCFRKTDDLIRWSSVVVCGNRVIAEHAAALGTATTVIPTVVDTERFRPIERDRAPGPPVLGWVGSHSTFRYLESIFPALEQLARACPFRLLIVGSGRDSVRLPGIDVVCRRWSLSREVADFQEIDIGLYPIVEEAWSSGKSGFKAIQYMATGLPFVVSPIGSCADIGEAGLTHFTATSPEDWQSALAALLGDPLLRRQMGEAGRRHALAHYAMPRLADRLADVLRMSATAGVRAPNH